MANEWFQRVGSSIPRGFSRYFILDLLTTKPHTGKEIIDAATQQSDGKWKPSPGLTETKVLVPQIQLMPSVFAQAGLGVPPQGAPQRSGSPDQAPPQPPSAKAVFIQVPPGGDPVQAPE